MAEYVFPGERTMARPGITLRDWLAAKAMQALCGRGSGMFFADDMAAQVAENAYLIADKMLERRGKST